jgi:hypothetical protein
MTSLTMSSLIKEASCSQPASLSRAGLALAQWQFSYSISEELGDVRRRNGLFQKVDVIVLNIIQRAVVGDGHGCDRGVLVGHRSSGIARFGTSQTDGIGPLSQEVSQVLR